MRRAIIFILMAAPVFAVDVNRDDVRTAVEKSLGLLQKTAPASVKRQGCVSCHNQALPAMALGVARERGFPFEQPVADQIGKAVAGMFTPAQEILLEGTDIIPELPMTGSYSLIGLGSIQYPADKMTAALVHNIAAKQQSDGHWYSPMPRPPLMDGDISATAASVRALQLYALPGRAEEFRRRAERAGAWLWRQNPATTEQKTMRLLGMIWANVDRETVNQAARELLAEQRPDGGWAPLETLDSDAYATGKVMVAIRTAGAIAKMDPAYQRGVAYLLRTQREDGSWLVRTRAFPFQPLIDTGFPHGRDQWASISGTSWAAMALMMTEDPA